MIRSVRSNFDLFLSGLPKVAAQIGELASRGNKLLSNDNLAGVSRLVASLDRATAALPQAARDATELISELRAATAASRALIAQISATTTAAGPDLVAAVARLRASADSLASASEQLDGILKEDRGALHGFAQESLPQLDALLRDSRDAAREISLLSKSLRENPARVLYQPASNAVEIPR